MKQASLFLLVLSLNGCASAPAIEHRDATSELIHHPEFKAAAQAAPNWVGQALQTITRYEAELASK